MALRLTQHGDLNSVRVDLIFALGAQEFICRFHVLALDKVSRSHLL